MVFNQAKAKPLVMCNDTLNRFYCSTVHRMKISQALIRRVSSCNSIKTSFPRRDVWINELRNGRQRAPWNARLFRIPLCLIIKNYGRPKRIFFILIRNHLGELCTFYCGFTQTDICSRVLLIYLSSTSLEECFATKVRYVSNEIKKKALNKRKLTFLYLIMYGLENSRKIQRLMNIQFLIIVAMSYVLLNRSSSLYLKVFC